MEPSLSLTELPERWPADLPTLPTRDPGRLADRARLARVRVTGDLHDAAFGQIRDRSPDSASGAPAAERFQADSRWLTSELGSANADALPRRSKRCWQAAPLGRPGSELNVRSTCPEVERPKRPAGDWPLCRLPSRRMTGLARWPTVGESERPSRGCLPTARCPSASGSRIEALGEATSEALVATFFSEPSSAGALLVLAKSCSSERFARTERCPFVSGCRLEAADAKARYALAPPHFDEPSDAQPQVTFTKSCMLLKSMPAARCP